MSRSRSAVHGQFTLSRSLAFTPAQVYAAWSTPEGKARWFAGPNGWQQHERTMDFRLGGKERVVGRHATGTVSSFDATYLDIVENQRIVYTYTMHLDDRKISVSLATVEFKPEKGGTRMVITEQGVFIDGYEDKGNREHGTAYLMEQVEASLRKGN